MPLLNGTPLLPTIKNGRRLRFRRTSYVWLPVDFTTTNVLDTIPELVPGVDIWPMVLRKVEVINPDAYAPWQSTSGERLYYMADVGA